LYHSIEKGLEPHQFCFCFALWASDPKTNKIQGLRGINAENRRKRHCKLLKKTLNLPPIPWRIIGKPLDFRYDVGILKN
jgi:hypothetical protein